MVWRFGSKRIGGYVIQLFENSIPRCIILFVTKSDNIAAVMESSPPNVTFIRDLSGSRLVSWNFLFQHLANVQLQDGSDEFC
jgi:hypothetical protein